MNKRLYLTVALVVTLLINLTACSGNADKKDSVNNPSLNPTLTVEASVAPTAEASAAGAAEAGTGEITADGADNTETVPTLLPASEETAAEIYNESGEDYKKMIETSLITTGNNFRVKKAIEKAKSGEEVTIAYIGGSITEGAGASINAGCYAYQSYLYFKDTFGAGDGKNVKFINAGMGGTPSALGVIRYDRDVTAFGQVQPDIVFIEFAVNDYDEPTKGKAYESLIRNVLSAQNQPAVVLLFSVFKTKWNMQDVYKPVGTYYQLPMISIKDAVVPELTEGRITEAEFFFDEYHPTNYGHGIMADCIKYYLNTANAEQASAEDMTIPDAAIVGKSFEGIKMLDTKTVDSNVTITPGSFNGSDKQIGTLLYANKKTFPDNWKHSTENGTDSFTVTLNCKNLLMVYKASSSTSFGEAEILIDGKSVTVIGGWQNGGWNNPVTALLMDEASAADHTIEIRMAEGSEEKEFTILAFGYTQ